MAPVYLVPMNLVIKYEHLPRLLCNHFEKSALTEKNWRHINYKAFCGTCKYSFETTKHPLNHLGSHWCNLGYQPLTSWPERIWLLCMFDVLFFWNLAWKKNFPIWKCTTKPMIFCSVGEGRFLPSCQISSKFNEKLLPNPFWPPEWSIISFLS